jgi:CBS domain-containing protein
MQLRDVMTRDVEVIHPDATVEEAAEKMEALNVGPLPVCDGRRLVGMITDRDITVRAVAAGVGPGEARVRDVMTPEVAYAFEDQDVREAERIMQEQQIRRLPILDRDKRLVGIVSLGDLAVDTDDADGAGETLERISEPARPER